VVEIESEIEGEPERQSIFYPWTKINWMYHPEEETAVRWILLRADRLVRRRAGRESTVAHLNG
jgi:hypothetical protein